MIYNDDDEEVEMTLSFMSENNNFEALENLQCREVSDIYPDLIDDNNISYSEQVNEDTYNYNVNYKFHTVEEPTRNTEKPSILLEKWDPYIIQQIIYQAKKRKKKKGECLCSKKIHKKSAGDNVFLRIEKAKLQRITELLIKGFITLKKYKILFDIIINNITKEFMEKESFKCKIKKRMGHLQKVS